MIYGYFRYSNNFSELLGILQNFGCDRIISDSAEHRTRPHFLSLLLTLQVGDTLVVVSFNHMGYRLTPFFELLLDFQNRGISLISCLDQFDSRTDDGHRLLSSWLSLYDMDRQLALEQTRYGQAAAQQIGKWNGRPKTGEAQIASAIQMYFSHVPIREICRSTKISATTLYKYLHNDPRFLKK